MAHKGYCSLAEQKKEEESKQNSSRIMFGRGEEASLSLNSLVQTKHLVPVHWSGNSLLSFG